MIFNVRSLLSCLRYGDWNIKPPSSGEVMNQSFLPLNSEQEALYNFLMGPMPWTSRSAAHRTGRAMASKDACLACLLLLRLIPGLKVTVGRNGLACLEVPVRHRGTPRQELKETWSGTHEGMLLPNLLEGSHSAIFPAYPPRVGTAHSGLVPPNLFCNLQSRKCPHRCADGRILVSHPWN